MLALLSWHRGCIGFFCCPWDRFWKLMLPHICRLAEAAVSEGEARVWKELLHSCRYSMYGKCDFQQWEWLRVRVTCCPLFNPPNYLHTSWKVTYVCGIWWMSRKASNIAASLKPPLQTPGDSVLSISVSAIVNFTTYNCHVCPAR